MLDSHTQAEITRRAVAELVTHFIESKLDDLALFTGEQVGVLWGVSAQTVRASGLPSVTFGKAIRYRMADVRAFLDRRQNLTITEEELTA